jgi:hypothetical protein
MLIDEHLFIIRGVMVNEQLGISVVFVLRCSGAFLMDPFTM